MDKAQRKKKGRRLWWIGGCLIAVAVWSVFLVWISMDFEEPPNGALEASLAAREEGNYALAETHIDRALQDANEGRSDGLNSIELYGTAMDVKLRQGKKDEALRHSEFARRAIWVEMEEDFRQLLNHYYWTIPVLIEKGKIGEAHEAARDLIAGLELREVPETGEYLVVVIRAAGAMLEEGRVSWAEDLSSRLSEKQLQALENFVPFDIALLRLEVASELSNYPAFLDALQEVKRLSEMPDHKIRLIIYSARMELQNRPRRTVLLVEELQRLLAKHNRSIEAETDASLSVLAARASVNRGRVEEAERYLERARAEISGIEDPDDAEFAVESVETELMWAGDERNEAMHRASALAAEAVKEGRLSLRTRVETFRRLYPILRSRESTRREAAGGLMSILEELNAKGETEWVQHKKLKEMLYADVMRAFGGAFWPV